MGYTYEPEERHARASVANAKISKKDAMKVYRVIRKKPLKRAKRLLIDLENQTRSLRGKYHTHAVQEILSLLESCEKNAEFLGLDSNRLFVHGSASRGTRLRRRRRKSGYGSTMKSTNMEIMLIERGKEAKTTKKKTQGATKKEPETTMSKQIAELHKKNKELKEKVDAKKEEHNKKPSEEKQVSA